MTRAQLRPKETNETQWTRSRLKRTRPRPTHRPAATCCVRPASSGGLDFHRVGNGIPKVGFPHELLWPPGHGSAFPTRFALTNRCARGAMSRSHFGRARPAASCQGRPAHKVPPAWRSNWAAARPPFLSNCDLSTHLRRLRCGCVQARAASERPRSARRRPTSDRWPR